MFCLSLTAKVSSSDGGKPTPSYPEVHYNVDAIHHQEWCRAFSTVWPKQLMSPVENSKVDRTNYLNFRLDSCNIGLQARAVNSNLHVGIEFGRGESHTK